MNGLRIDDDFFSPIRFESSLVESSEDSDTVSNSDHALGNNSMKIGRPSELDLNLSDLNITSVESVAIYTPVLDKGPSDLMYMKKVDETKYFEDKDVKTQTPKNVGYLNKKSKNMVNVLDCNTPELQSEKIFKKKSSKSISTSTESSEYNMQDIARTNTTRSSKNICVENKQASSGKHSSEKNPIHYSSHLKNVSAEKCKDVSEKSKKSIESKERNTTFHPTREKSNVLIEDVESTVDQPLSHYEASIERIVHENISFECAKIRQNIYMQQMSFYRQINRIKTETEQQYLATYEHLFRVIEELKQINTTLKSMLENVKN